MLLHLGRAEDDPRCEPRGVTTSVCNRRRHPIVLFGYIPGLEICTVGELVDSLQGLAILIMQQYTYAGRGKTVHSWEQTSRGCAEDKRPEWGPGSNNPRIGVPQRQQFNSWSSVFEDDRALHTYNEPYDSDYSEHMNIPTCLSTTSTSDGDVDIIW